MAAQTHDSTPTDSDLTPTERGVAALWCEVLMSEQPLTAADNFFALGGDSLAMTMVLFRIKEEFSVDLPPASLAEAPDLRSFSVLVDSARSAASVS